MKLIAKENKTTNHFHPWKPRVLVEEHSNTDQRDDHIDTASVQQPSVKFLENVTPLLLIFNNRNFVQLLLDLLHSELLNSGIPLPRPESERQRISGCVGSADEKISLSRLS